MVDDFTIRPDDVRRAGYCMSGARRWFRSHGLDFRTFLKNGIPAADLLATGDAQAIRTVEVTREARRGKE